MTCFTPEPRPNLSRRLGPNTDSPVYTHTWRPAEEKGHIGLGTQRWGTVSLSTRREKPENLVSDATQGSEQPKFKSLLPINVKLHLPGGDAPTPLRRSFMGYPGLYVLS